MFSDVGCRKTRRCAVFLSLMANLHLSVGEHKGGAWGAEGKGLRRGQGRGQRGEGKGLERGREGVREGKGRG